jgi:hypothetical protein
MWTPREKKLAVKREIGKPRNINTLKTIKNEHQQIPTDAK